MILLQNPNLPVPTNAVEIDAAILDIKAKLESGLTWLTNGYGRTYKNLDARNGTTVFYPEAYLGEQNNSHRYINLSPDNDKQGQCFFYVVRENITQFQPGMYSFLSYDTAIIFSVNMELINDALLQTEIYQQILVAQVRDVLTRQLLGSEYQLTVTSVDFLFETVFSEFDLADAQQLEKAPLSHFRFNVTIQLPETCPTPSIIPPITTCYSLEFDGVNEYVDCTNNAVFNQDFNTPFSIGLWVKANSLSLLNFMLTKFDIAASKGWEFTLLNGTIRLIFSTGIGAATKIVSDGTTVINVDQWYHLAMTYDGTNDHNGITLYIDGAIDIKSNSSGSGLVGTVQNAKNLQIGGQDGFYFDGNIASARMWNTELTSVQVNAEYNGGVILNPAVQGVDLILETDINNANFDGSDWQIPDLTGITSGYTSVNMETGDRVEDCPS